MGALDDALHIEPRTRTEWRKWLAANHDTSSGVWLVGMRRGGSGARLDNELDYNAAVEEALCFGWIDSQAARFDEQRSKQYFAPRRPGSPWAATNKVRIEQMVATGKMTAAGLAVIERAKADGSWTVFDSVERLEVPADLAAALDGLPPARSEWDAFPPSARKALLAWIALAKRPDTRAERIADTAAAAQRGQRANDPTAR